MLKTIAIAVVLPAFALHPKRHAKPHSHHASKPSSRRVIYTPFTSYSVLYSRLVQNSIINIILNFEDIWLVEAGFWEMNGVVNDILVLKMVAKIVFVQNHKFEILNPNPKPQSQILNPNPKPISRS